MSGDEGHWLDDEPAAAAPVTPGGAAAPATPVGVVATRIADVSPAWAAVTISAEAAPAAPTGVEALGRDRAFGLESIREGWLLHRGASRVAPAAPPDLALLVGDWCYAAGLCSIADHGRLDDVAELARLVAEVSARATEPAESLQQRWDEATEALARG